MAVFRIEKTSSFVVMSKFHLKEKNMSLKAKGLLSLMLSLPDNWDYSLKGLASLSKDNIDSVRSAVKELEKFGYLKVNRVRDSKGVFLGIEYLVFESPQLDFPNMDKPNLDKPNLENPTQLNNKKELNNNIIKKAKKGTFSDFQQNNYDMDELAKKLISN